VSTKPSKRAAQPSPPNVGILLRDPFRALVGHIHRRLAERGHPEIRPAHGNVFQFLDAEGTRVSVLAERAQMTKQSMAELVAHLEANGYVERIPDPTDRRAKLVRATPKGLDSVPVALEAIAEVEAYWTERLGAVKMRRLRKLLEELNAKL
jgi:DNA-binding MarR family transcriptional regulator